jgi:integrase
MASTPQLASTANYDKDDSRKKISAPSITTVDNDALRKSSVDRMRSSDSDLNELEVRMARHRRDIPWVQRRGNGKFYAFWYDDVARQTRRRSLGTSNPDDAASAFEDFLNARGRREQFVLRELQILRGMTVAELVAHFIQNHVEKNYICIARTRSMSSNLNAFFSRTRIRDVDIPACEAYADARRAGKVRSVLLRDSGRRRKAQDGTIRRELVFLGSAARWAIRHKLIPPYEMPTIEAPPEPLGRIVFLSRAELQLAFETAAFPLREFIALAYYTGARRRAVEALTPLQVDMEHNLITLQPSAASTRQRRSKKRKPIIPILSDLQILLRGWLPNLRLDEPILPKRNYYLLFKRHLTALGSPNKAFPHVLRHTRATHLLQDGATVYDVAKLIGDLPTTIEKTYAHHSSDYLAKALEGKGLRLL